MYLCETARIRIQIGANFWIRIQLQCTIWIHDTTSNVCTAFSGIQSDSVPESGRKPDINEASQALNNHENKDKKLLPPKTTRPELT